MATFGIRWIGPTCCLGLLLLQGSVSHGAGSVGLGGAEADCRVQDPNSQQVVRVLDRYARLLRQGKAPDPLDQSTLEALAQLLEDPHFVPKLLPPLLDVLGASGGKAPGGPFKVGAKGTSARALRTLVRRMLGAGEAVTPLITGLSFGVVLNKKEELARRKTALNVLQSRHLSAGRQCLLTVGRSLQDPLRPVALMYSAGWNDPALDRMLVGLLGEPEVEGLVHPSVPLLQRTQADRRPLGKGARKDLQPLLSALMAGPDWRDTVRAIQMSRGFAPEDRIPILIDGMLVWDQLKRAKTGSRRVTNDFARALSDISGRSIGTNPRNWIQWWVSVRQGKIPMHKTEREKEAPRTRASFFGLDIDGDRVTFVLDNSGSMDGVLSSGMTRHELALEQLFSALEGLGEGAVFNVILFSSGPPIYSGDMLKPTPKNIARLRQSLGARQPGGGTNLRPAIEEALAHGPAGKIDPKACMPDTVVVLCDGATGSGPGWVRDYLDRLLPVLQVRFYCVLLGGQGDGTLRLLAEISGGRIVSPKAL
ncbi:MAG TPA: VWA domain-containing protein [Planctomycetes bacterium]|nr:VWA domain-containing protein [Planctomycetota bacterium]HIL36584.1 VWA domain-containing protein [Planctomycetota bacterium]